MRESAVCTVLDAALGDGQAFLEFTQSWLASPERPPVLHYVGLIHPDQRTSLCPEVEDLCAGLEAGIHRLLLHNGQVALTLCLGATDAMLSEQVMQAQRVWIRPGPQLWDKWLVKTLSKCCATDALVAINQDVLLEPSWLREAGFVAEQDCAPYSHRYHPPWLGASRRKVSVSAPGRHCAVVGAGIAGAGIAQALARRGWSVEVLDGHPHSAGGASGLPVGLVVPHVSADDAPRSRLTRKGTRLMLHHAHALLQRAQDWELSGVQERRLATHTTLWHPQAAWIKPARLVQAWLNTPGIALRTSSQVHTVARSAQGERWDLRDSQGQLLCQADHVVFANAIGARALLLDTFAAQEMVTDLHAKIEALHALHGTLSYGACSPGQWAGTELDGHVHPVNGKGSFVPNIPDTNSGTDVNTGATHWYAGSTFEFSAEALDDVAQQHQANFERLARLLPAVGHALANDFATVGSGAAAKVHAWCRERCAGHDRLPLVGPVLAGDAPSVWMLAGMGSRGLSFSALCAELLASYMGGEPLPLEASLARSLHTTRRYKQRTGPLDGI